MTKIIDIHRHLWGYDWFPPSHLPKFSAEPIAKKTGRTVDEVLERIKQSPTMDATGKVAIDEMDHYGIDVSIIQVLDWGLAYGPGEDNQVPAEEFNRLTQEVCKKYNKSFKKLSGVIIPNSNYSDVSPFCYVLRILDNKREKLIEFLKNHSIDTGIHWTPAHKFSYFSDVKCGDLEITEKISSEILTIPLHSNMKNEYVERIIDSITEFYRNQNNV